MTSKPTQSPYTGLLAEPEYQPTLLTSGEKDLRVRAWLRTKKTILLFKHFHLNIRSKTACRDLAMKLAEQHAPAFQFLRIDPNDKEAWFDIALALATTHVPGFQPPPVTRGHPFERADDDIKLVMLVRLLKLRGCKTDLEAFEKISASGSIAGAVSTLSSRCIEARKRLRSVLEFFDRMSKAVGEEAAASALEDAVGHLLISHGEIREKKQYTDFC
jgi:hypothetical protein